MSSPQPDKRGVSDFQSLFEKAAQRLGVGVELKAIRVCQAARHSVHALLPDHHHEVEVISYKNGTISLRAASSGIRQRLQTKAHLIQEALNQEFGNQTVNRVSIRV